MKRYTNLKKNAVSTKNINLAIEYSGNSFFEEFFRLLNSKGIRGAVAFFGMVFVLAGCTKNINNTELPTNDPIKTPINSPVNPDISPQNTPNNSEQALQSVAPTPTLTEEEQKNIQEYEALRRYYENYQDHYALYLIRLMYDDGKITEEMLLEVNEDIFMMTEDDYKNIGAEYEADSSIINGRCEEISDDSFGYFVSRLLMDAENGIIRISILDTWEQRERLEQGLEIIKEFQENPIDENRIKFEDMIFSEELTSGEVLMLYMWFCYNPNAIDEITVNGEIYDNDNYTFMKNDRYGESIGERIQKAHDALFVINNTPNSEKEQSTEPSEVAYIETENYEGDPVSFSYHS